MHVAVPLMLSVLIVSWNTRDVLARCLESLAHGPDLDVMSRTAATDHQSLSQENTLLSAEVWVVDNGSADGSPAMVRERFPWVRLIENCKNAGFAAANNQAMRQARGRYLVLLNSDTEVRPGALRVLVDFVENYPQAGAAGARLLNADGSLQISCHPMLTPGREFWRLLFLDRIWRRATYPMWRWDTDRLRQVEVIKGACLLLRRQALDQVGLLDEVYFMYTEEVDLCYRLAEQDWELWWVPEAKVVHYEAQSSRQMAERMYVQLHRSKVQFYRKFGGQRAADRFKLFVRLAYWPRLVVATLGGPLSATLAAQARTYRRLLSELGAM